MAFCPRIAIGHIGSAPFMRGDNWLKLGLPGKRWKKRIDEPARHEEEMRQPFLNK
jgi:hypothetical protein